MGLCITLNSKNQKVRVGENVVITAAENQPSGKGNIKIIIEAPKETRIERQKVKPDE